MSPREAKLLRDLAAALKALTERKEAKKVLNA